jgi:hypothetical protein
MRRSYGWGASETDMRHVVRHAVADAGVQQTIYTLWPISTSAGATFASSLLDASASRIHSRNFSISSLRKEAILFLICGPPSLLSCEAPLCRFCATVGATSPARYDRTANYTVPDLRKSRERQVDRAFCAPAAVGRAGTRCPADIRLQWQRRPISIPTISKESSGKQPAEHSHSLRTST